MIFNVNSNCSNSSRTFNNHCNFNRQAFSLLWASTHSKRMALCRSQLDFSNSHNSQTYPDSKVSSNRNLPVFNPLFSKPLSMANKQAHPSPTPQSAHSNLNPPVSRTPYLHLYRTSPPALMLSYRPLLSHNRLVNCRQTSFRAHSHRHLCHRFRKTSNHCSHLYRKRQARHHRSDSGSRMHRN